MIEQFLLLKEKNIRLQSKGFPMKILLSIFLFTIMLFSNTLTRSGHAIIDDSNKLMWQDTRDNIKVSLKQEKAQLYCKDLNLKGFRNWRLPTIEEYKTIINKKRIRAELMIKKSFKYTLKSDYWTSDRTWLRNFGQYGYYVYFKSGSIYYQNRNQSKFVRCVRDL